MLITMMDLEEEMHKGSCIYGRDSWSGSQPIWVLIVGNRGDPNSTAGLLQVLVSALMSKEVIMMI